MKTRISIATALMIFCASSFAIDIDITEHPDKDFILGYKHKYPGDCNVMWWASRWNTEHIMGVGECDGISEEKVMADMSNLMSHVKATTNHKNFSEYLREQEHQATYDLRRGFCIFRSAADYVFTTVESPDSPGWNIIYSSQTPVYGLWKISPNGDVISRAGLNRLHPVTRVVDASQAVDCKTLKPYAPALP